MKIDHRGVDGLMTEQVLDRQNVQTFFQQMSGKSMPERVHVHRLLDPGFLFGFIHCPLNASLRIAGIEVTTDPAFDLLIFAIEHPFVGLLGLQIGFQSADQDISQRDIAVFFAFPILHMKDFPVKIQVGDLQIPNFEAAETTAIQQSDQHAVFEQFGSFEKPADFLLAQDNGKLFAVLDRWKFDPLVLHPLNPISESKGIDSELKVGIRRCVMTPLDQMQVIIDPVWIHCSRQFIKVKSEFGQMTAIVGEGTLTFARDSNFLLKLGQ